MQLQIKTKLLFVLSFLLRAATFFAALLLFMMAINNVIQAIPKLANIQKYQELENYMGITISEKVDMSTEGLRKLDKQMTAFFKETNELGGVLFAIEGQFEIYNNIIDWGVRKEDLKLTDYAISVNNNYLKLNPAYDLDGNAVFVDEDVLKFTILVPEKYRSREKELFDHYTEELTFLNYYNQDLELKGQKYAHSAVHEPLPVEIIFIKDNQKFFMYDSSYNRHVNEYIESPIIKIVTTANVSQPQIPNYITTQKFVVDVVNHGELVEEALVQTGLDESIMKRRNPYDEYSAVLKKTGFIALVQLVLLAIAMFLGIISVRLIRKKVDKKQTLWLLASWIVIVVPLMVFKNLNLLIYTLVAIFLISADVFFLMHKSKKKHKPVNELLA